MRRRVAITGLGLVSSQGQSPREAFEAWCRGESGIAMHSVGEAPHAVTVPYALCTGFDAAASLGRSRLATMDRVSQLGTVAALSAWGDAGLSDWPAAEREHACVLWGTGAGGAQTLERSYRDLFLKGRSRISPLSVVLGMHNAATAHIALHLGLGGDCLSYSVACASSAVAVGEGFRRIALGEADVVLSGGSEAGLPFGMLKAWESMQVMARGDEDAAASCRPFDAQRTGLVLGEGAAALVLEDWDHATRRGARIVAEVVGYGSSCDHSHLTSPDAGGQLRALTQALKVAGLQPSDVQYVNAHGTATPEGDPVEVQALKALMGGHAAQLMVSSTKSMHGHWLGGAGAVEIMATALALHTQQVPPTAGLRQLDAACEGVLHVAGEGRRVPGLNVALSNSFAFGGSNAVLALRAASA
jgi:3-oxoacyl-[acyl-carrier-protein] synthase II